MDVTTIAIGVFLGMLAYNIIMSIIGAMFE